MVHCALIESGCFRGRHQQGHCGSKDGAAGSKVCRKVVDAANGLGGTAHSHSPHLAFIQMPSGQQHVIDHGDWRGKDPRKHEPKHEEPRPAAPPAIGHHSIASHEGPQLFNHPLGLIQAALANLRAQAANMIKESRSQRPRARFGHIQDDRDYHEAVPQREYPRLELSAPATLVEGSGADIADFFSQKMQNIHLLGAERVQATAIVMDWEVFEELNLDSPVFAGRITDYELIDEDDIENPILEIGKSHDGPKQVLLIENMIELFNPTFDRQTYGYIIDLLAQQAEQPNPNLCIVATLDMSDPHLTQAARERIPALFPEGKVINL